MKVILLLPAILAVLRAETIPECVKTESIEQCVENRLVWFEMSIRSNLTKIESRLSELENKYNDESNMENGLGDEIRQTTLKPENYKVKTSTKKLHTTKMTEKPTEKKEEHTQPMTTKTIADKITTKVDEMKTTMRETPEIDMTTVTPSTVMTKSSTPVKVPLTQKLMCDKTQTINQLPNCNNPKYIITSLNYPQSYPFNYQCKIILDEIDNSVIHIKFLDFHVEQGQSCPFDKLTFKEGSNSATLCGRGHIIPDDNEVDLFQSNIAIPKLNTTYTIDPNGPVEISFLSDNIVREKGFVMHLEFKCVDN
ncbi:DgyrCDS3300 [Dimorphilus gyrociliatus]|uniref:DgyrCDS3300 n=1 Tax=Dimorphilus gyrociliatus TaxID=2664684 RepID=A0A7I8VFU0_9ANNE|nr:DgyrCDS3300 [Dimorphilus gyrociliatus]